MFKLIKTEIPDQLWQQAQNMVKQGWIDNMDALIAEAMRRYIDLINKRSANALFVKILTGACMEKTREAVIADAGPIIHLHELNSLDLLADFDKVIVPDTVWNEVEQHRPQALACFEVKFIRQCAVHFIW